MVISFNTQPPEGGWPDSLIPISRTNLFQHTAARRRLDTEYMYVLSRKLVSTHSRPKAAGLINLLQQLKQQFQHTAARRRLDGLRVFVYAQNSFNTQPPEGGWTVRVRRSMSVGSFNTQPPEGGWDG